MTGLSGVPLVIAGEGLLTKRVGSQHPSKYAPARRPRTRFITGLSLVHPVGVAAAWIITLYADTGTPPWAVWRPWAIGTIAALVLQLLLTASIHRAAISSFLTTILVLSFASLWYFSLPLTGYLGTSIPTSPHRAWLSFNDPLILTAVPVEYSAAALAGG